MRSDFKSVIAILLIILAGTVFALLARVNTANPTPVGTPRVYTLGDGCS